MATCDARDCKNEAIAGFKVIVGDGSLPALETYWCEDHIYCFTRVKRQPKGQYLKTKDLVHWTDAARSLPQ
jgi:hypothetical protein